MNPDTPYTRGRQRRWWITPLEILLVISAIWAAAQLAEYNRLSRMPVVHYPRDGGDKTVFCEWEGTAAAWVDTDGSGTRDPGEPALPGVHAWVYYGGAPQPRDPILVDRTDWKGEAWFLVPLNGCPEKIFKIEMSIPEGMRLTTAASTAFVDVRDSGRVILFGFQYLPGMEASLQAAEPPPAEPQCQSFSPPPQDTYDDVRKILVAPDGNVWMVTVDPWMRRSIARLDPESGAWNRGWRGDHVWALVPSIARDPSGDVWVMEYPGATRVRDGDQFTFPPDDNGEPRLTYNGMAFDRDGTLWLTDSHTLWHLDGRTGRVLENHPFGAYVGSDDFGVNVFPGPDGSIWMSTTNRSRTLRLLPQPQPDTPREWQVYYGGESQSDLYTPRDFAATPDGTLWFANDTGVTRYNTQERTWAKYTIDTTDHQMNLATPEVVAAAYDGSVWIGGGDRHAALVRYIPRSANYPVDVWTRYDLESLFGWPDRGEYPADAIHDIDLLPDGSLWLGTSHGAARCVFR